MKLITFYAECDLPKKPRAKQEGFDWRLAIHLLEKSATCFGHTVEVVTDTKTDIKAALRVGDAREQGIMHWLLAAQTAAIAKAQEPGVLVSPDTLIAGPIDVLFGDWDVALLTRRKPKPIVNSVIGFKPSESLVQLWRCVEDRAKTLSKESQEWGADIDAVVDVLNIKPNELSVREVAGVRIRTMPIHGFFQSVSSGPSIEPPMCSIWDFKGARKQRMQDYARRIQC